MFKCSPVRGSDSRTGKLPALIPMTATRERIASVDLVRLVSILVVFAVHLHASGLVRLPESSLARAAWLYFARNGSYGVSLFFVVSGFVITRTILRRSPSLAGIGLRDFYTRRAGRILPRSVLLS